MKAVSDYVLVEADGSKGLPLKAHGSHEPVVPEDTDHLIWVVGASGFGRPAGEVLHRPEHFITEAGRSIDADVIVSPEMYAYHMARETERLAKSRGNWKRLTVLINQVDRSNDETADKARRFASVYRNSCQYNGAMSILTGSLRADHFYIL
jgi:probable selenium-dependent hydroxylase accessory protein YqeC